MNGCKIAEFPQDKYRFRIYDNPKKKSWQTIQAETGSCALINLGYFSFSTFEPDDALMVAGKWLRQPAWGYHGILIDADGHLSIGSTVEAVYDYCNGEPVYMLGGADYPGASHFGRDGNTMLGVKADGTVVLLLCAKDNGQTSAEGVKALEARGCVHILRFDGSWSSQGSLGPGLDVDPSQERKVRSYLLVFKKKEDKPVDKNYYTVTPGAGVNIRSGPGTGYGKVGAYAQGAVVAVLEEQDGWGRTDMGWVSMAYLEPVETARRVTDNGITIQQNVIPAGRRNRPGGRNPDVYITIHETGNTDAGADAEAHGKYLTSSAGEASLTSWHYTVDDHAIVQHLPDNETAYHAGDGATGPGNTASIGIEICVNSDGDFEKAKANAAALVRLLMAEHGIPLGNIKQHHDWNGKDCPATIRSTHGAWEDFLALCGGGSGQEEPEEPQQPAADKPDAWAEEDWAWAQAMGLLDGTRPTAASTRQEAAVMFRRFYEAIKAGK